MALALGGLLGLLAFMLCPTEAVVGKHNCPLDCNGHGLCSMTEEMKCTCYAGWTESALCDKRKWLTILTYTFPPLASLLLPVAQPLFERSAHTLIACMPLR
jgi:hypothetical protein